jgi:hypothetical protein
LAKEPSALRLKPLKTTIYFSFLCSSQIDFYIV